MREGSNSMYVCVPVCVCVCVCVYTCVSVSVCACVCVCVYSEIPVFTDVKIPVSPVMNYRSSGCRFSLNVARAFFFCGH